MTVLDRKDVEVDVIFKVVPKTQNCKDAEAIILNHKEIADRFGTVWVGTNQNFSEDKINLIRKNGNQMRLLFVSNETDKRKHEVLYTADLIDIETYSKRKRGTVSYDNNLVPLYYILEKKRVWFKVSNFTKLSSSEISLGDYRLLFKRSNASIEEILDKGQCCLMYAYREESTLETIMTKGIYSKLMNDFRCVDFNHEYMEELLKSAAVITLDRCDVDYIDENNYSYFKDCLKYKIIECINLCI